jgi:flagellar hook-associated protein 1 FlgK
MLAFSTPSGNFDPATHSLEDVRAALNAMTITDTMGRTVTDSTGNPVYPIQASIQDGKLLLEVDPSSDIAFTFGTDTTGLMAALGLNTFFSGSSAETLALNSDVRNNCELISAGHVDGGNEINEGDNAIATAIGVLSEKNVTVTTFWKTVKDQSLSEYYANLVTTVGSDKRRSATNADYNKALSDDLNERLQSVEGVNLDEELSNLIKYQHSYTAAAKLITTADQMLQTLLGLKQ